MFSQTKSRNFQIPNLRTIFQPIFLKGSMNTCPTPRRLQDWLELLPEFAPNTTQSNQNWDIISATTKTTIIIQQKTLFCPKKKKL